MDEYRPTLPINPIVNVKKFQRVQNRLLFLPAVIALFALMYYPMRGEFKGMKTPFDSLYFSFTTFSTAYGDIAPLSTRAKALVMTQQLIMLLDIISIYIDG